METVMLESQSGLSMASLGEVVSAASAALPARRLATKANRKVVIFVQLCSYMQFQTLVLILYPWSYGEPPAECSILGKIFCGGVG